ncbi:phage adaptor protein [Undibacterium sp. TJN19]|uniref:phage adaptor protein n=1 Tax=Undibacterium sp. TJN19 TaxID=3413055 RepID=UPI003BF0AB0A
MSAITDYASLQTAVINWLHRSDLAAFVPDFIALAEGKMSSDIVARPMDVRTTLTTSTGNAYVTLPGDMLEMNRLILMTDPVYTLRYESPDQLSIDYPTALTGKPSAFAVIGSQLQLAPIPDTAYTLELTYQQRIPALSSTNTTNWLLTAFPNVYLYAALCAAQPFIMNDARIPTFERLYMQGIEAINSIDWYSGSTMRVRAR